MQLPEQLLRSLTGLEGFNKEAFEKVHLSGEQVTSIRINPSKELSIADCRLQIPWTQYGYYLSKRPSFTFDPLFHAGCYYVQEASSMFLEQALKQTVDISRPLKVLDLCAAPGGKSTHLQSLISKDSLLVSNEVIRSRVNILKDNIIKWGSDNVVVTHNDPKDFETLEHYFDVIVVDAPCSGSGLFRREPDAINEWSTNNVQLCSQRQQRILMDVWPSLKKDGVLIYSTCSYSREEDEDLVNWLLEELPIAHCPLSIDPSSGITKTQPGYRFWPDKVKGEGFFIAAFQKTEGKDQRPSKTRAKVQSLTKREIAIVEKWLRTEGMQLVRNQETVYAWPAPLVDDIHLLLNRLRVVYSGILAGELVRDKLVPDHALAMSNKIAATIERNELAEDTAIHYLQRKDVMLNTKTKGWQLVTYKDQPLGWINVLPNRINNYYPKELRILSEKPNLKE